LCRALSNAAVCWQATPGRLTGRVEDVAISPDGRLVASAETIPDLPVKVWRASDGAWERDLAFPGGALSVAFSPDGRKLAAGGDYRDNRVWVWNVQDGSIVWRGEGHGGGVPSVAFSPDARLLASAGGYEDKCIRLWNVATGLPVRSLVGHQALVRRVTFAPDGAALLSASDDGSIRLWHVTSGACLAEYTTGISPASLAISPSQRYLAYGRSDATLLLARVPGDAPILHLLGPAGVGNLPPQMLILGVPGSEYLLQHSSNLIHWQDWFTLTLSQSVGAVADPAFPVIPMRFYRAIGR
jgi:WD40 repeat protein